MDWVFASMGLEWTLFLVISCCIALFVFSRSRAKQTSSDGVKSAQLSSAKSVDADIEAPYRNIAPLPTFDWATEPRAKIRPFKPKYHLSMSLLTTTMDDLVAVDDTYLTRVRLRRQLMADHPKETLASLPESPEMISELYAWMMGVYLPMRFPTMFSLIPAHSPSSMEKADVSALPRQVLYNKVLDEHIPLTPPADPLDALRILSAHVDTDFIFLSLRHPDKSEDKSEDEKSYDNDDTDDRKYHMEAFATCYPSGFSTLGKLGLPLAAIHAPVPRYDTKLKKSMDRYFANLPVGKIVKRANWTITTDDQLFCEEGSHFHDEPTEQSANEDGVGGDAAGAMDDDIRRQRAEVNTADCRLRCERQTLHRLPRTKGLVFAFKTYQYTLAEIKEEGSGEELAAAIDGMSKGNVPEMQHYKRRVVWGDAVIDYLRG